MKQNIDPKILTKIGRVLSKNGIGVEKSNFVQVPKASFTLQNVKQKLHNKNGFVVCVNTKTDVVWVARIEDSYGELETNIAYRSDEQLTYEPQTTFSTLKSNFNLFYVVDTHDDISSKQKDRADANKQDPLDQKHAQIVNRVEIQELNKKLQQVGANLAGMRFVKMYTDSYDKKNKAIRVEFDYSKLPDGAKDILRDGLIIKNNGKYHLIQHINFSHYNDENSELSIGRLDRGISLGEAMKMFNNTINYVEKSAGALKAAKAIFEVMYNYDVEKIDTVRRMLTSE